MAQPCGNAPAGGADEGDAHPLDGAGVAARGGSAEARGRAVRTLRLGLMLLTVAVMLFFFGEKQHLVEYLRSL